MIQAMEGSTYIVHTASPFPIEEPKDENILIKPAVEGTLAVMKAAKINKVKRVVITSSIVSIFKNGVEGQTHFTENDWTDTKIAPAYDKSKTLAEKAAWDFISNLPDDEKIELATINPGFVLGPNLNEA
jgi:dihydroflavonol-4-reductase